MEDGFLKKALQSYERLVQFKESGERAFSWRTEWEFFLERLTQPHARNFRSGLSRWLFLIKEKEVNSNLEADAIQLWNALFEMDSLFPWMEDNILKFGGWFLGQNGAPIPLERKDHEVESVDNFSLTIVQTHPEIIGYSNVHQRNWIVELGRNGYFNFSSYLPLLEIGQKVSLFHFLVDGNVLKVSSDSRMVLDPDALFSVSDISEVFAPNGQRWKSFFGNKLKVEVFSIHLLIGTVANDLLDQMVVSGRYDSEWIQQTIRKSLLRNKLQSALFEQSQLKDLVHKIQNIVAPNLIPFVQRIRQGSNDIRIEPTFVSVADGFTGRLDLLLENESGAMDIIELKSGRAPEVWIDLKYEVQTILYYRLIRQTYGDKASVSGAILYASSADRSLRNLNVDQIYPYLIQADEARNLILSTCKRLASFQLQEVHGALKSLDPAFESNQSAFGIKKIATFLEGYQSIQAFSKPNFLRAYFLGMFSVQMREWLSLKLGDFQSGLHRKNKGAASIWLESVEEKLDKFSMIHAATLVDVDDQKLVFQHNGWPHPFRLGSQVQITACQNDGTPIALQEQWFRGVVSGIEAHQLTVQTLAPRFSDLHLKSIPSFNIEEVFLDSNIWANLKSLSNLFPSAKNTKTIENMLGLTEPTYSNSSFSQVDRAELAVEMAEAANDYLLIQGPPGTGKTSKVLTHIVRKFLARGDKTVVLAFTNRAVEEIAHKFKAQNIPYFSLRTEETDHIESIKDYSEAIKQSSVFLSTIASFTARFPDLLSITGEIPNLIVDEASQVTESQLAGVIPLFKRFILIGDHQQLPPVLSQDFELNDISKLKSFQNSAIKGAIEEMEELGLFSRWTDSLFERLWFLNDRNGWNGLVTLDTHFRMHEDIASSLSNHYLPTVLQAGNEPQRLGWFFDDWWGNLTHQKRMVFLENRNIDRGKINRSEAEDIARIVLEIHHRKEPEMPWVEFMGIITPWRAQIEEIKDAIRNQRSMMNMEEEIEKLIAIDTVERFQGSEADYIFFSTCINGAHYLEAFTSTEQNGVDRKLLVAASRARKQFVLLGNRQFLKDSNPYAQMLDWFETHGIALTMD
jgi:DNA replication ATP-dependent helicase Dna2